MSFSFIIFPICSFGTKHFVDVPIIPICLFEFKLVHFEIFDLVGLLLRLKSMDLLPVRLGFDPMDLMYLIFKYILTLFLLDGLFIQSFNMENELVEISESIT